MKKQTDNQFALVSDASLIETVLGGWNTLNSAITKLTKRQVAVLLIAELGGKQREPILRRLHQRYGIMRSKDEWKALSSMMKDGVDTNGVMDKLRVYNLHAIKDEVA